MSDFDFLDDVSAIKPGGDNMKKLSELVTTHGKYSDAIKILQERLKNGNKMVKQLEEEFIPDLMQEVGMKEFKTDDFTVKILSFVRGSIPTQNAIDKKKGDEAEEMQERRNQALSWLEDHGGDSIIKREFSLNLGKGSSDEVKESLVKIAVELGLPYDDAENVHAGTLNAFIKEKIEDGGDVPSDIFNLFVGDKAKIVKR